MSKKSPEPESLEAQIHACAKQCGLTPDEAASALEGVSARSPVGAIGDGVLLGKLFDFIKLILPLLLPLITKNPPPA